ncbi:hypothetical protein [Megasphaera hominis]|jgi:DNA-binding ferritin-like protein (Dps family)|uniref:Uncharacterized protein n=1 Tax=Megasphaera hominis TaxID=159836 RepID=A0ABR6VFQ3_9FIRM|nr:hypothetical protein [Megasphaera hominis]MBC3536030.1 hypothetical protein [Megasphaera hominis]
MSEDVLVPRAVLPPKLTPAVSELPEVIGAIFKELQSLKGQVRRAGRYAEAAKSTADNAQRTRRSWFIFHNHGDAIRRLQGAVSTLADAQVTTAQAQRVSFDYQERVGELTKYLFALGAADEESCQTVLHELEEKLYGPDGKDLSELVRRELLGVVQQLQNQFHLCAGLAAQEEKQVSLEKEVAALTAAVKNLRSQNADQEKRLAALEAALEEQEKKDQASRRKWTLAGIIGMGAILSVCLALL